MARNLFLSEQKTTRKKTQGPSSSAGLVFFENQSSDRTRQADIQSRINQKLLTQEISRAQFRLILTDKHLLLQLNQEKAPAVYADFTGGKALYRLGQGELITRAMGITKLDNPYIIDATAGLGRDAFVLASKGCHVTMIERAPLVFLLLEDALQRARENPDTREIAERMQLINSDANDYLNTKNASPADIVYLDPMYPERKKTALVKKEMQLFQVLLKNDDPGHALLQPALQKAGHRVVVKRPRKGEYLNQQKPDFSLTGKSIRFDVYLANR